MTSDGTDSEQAADEMVTIPARTGRQLSAGVRSCGCRWSPR